MQIFLGDIGLITVWIESREVDISYVGDRVEVLYTVIIIGQNDMKYLK